MRHAIHLAAVSEARCVALQHYSITLHCHLLFVGLTQGHSVGSAACEQCAKCQKKKICCLTPPRALHPVSVTLKMSHCFTVRIYLTLFTPVRETRPTLCRLSLNSVHAVHIGTGRLPCHMLLQTECSVQHYGQSFIEQC